MDRYHHQTKQSKVACVPKSVAHLLGGWLGPVTVVLLLTLVRGVFVNYGKSEF